jgi:hypothetical protein
MPAGQELHDDVLRALIKETVTPRGLESYKIDIRLWSWDDPQCHGFMINLAPGSLTELIVIPLRTLDWLCTNFGTTDVKMVLDPFASDGRNNSEYRYLHFSIHVRNPIYPWSDTTDHPTRIKGQGDPMKSMQYLDNDKLRQVIAELCPVGGLFDATDLTDVIRRLLQHDYIRELHDKLHCADPFQQLHADIASRLSQFTDLIERVPGERAHRNIFGNINTVSVWRRIA